MLACSQALILVIQHVFMARIRVGGGIRSLLDYPHTHTILSMSLLLLDMCLYKDGTTRSTPIYPPDDLDYDRVKSTDHEPDDGEWRLVTVEWCHVFNNSENKNTQHKHSRRVKGYGRITVLEKHPSEVFYEFAFWNVPECNADMPPADADEQEQEPFWDSRDVHWQHTWQAFHHHDCRLECHVRGKDIEEYK